PQFQWRQSWFDLSAYRGQDVTLTFRGEQNAKAPTLFYLDDIRLDAHYPQEVYLPLVLRNYPSQGLALARDIWARILLTGLLMMGMAVVLMERET
ncbi:MAG: hypothetical protein ACE5LU_30085, partial [Anaerolineae bacterium]